ncbi:hypothetical protein [Ancylobacter defluvii]|uniref:Uncharacterized protein n=1 Tax=Ancylobacter defluvii TaxID=1282440 RepID=A0A9W6JVQ9_9HYPH|nr:hypothetical protein [Ancylobacter defluvii]MBS7589052.1 hypothetical protein [Ancylobacter defluvii]GLK84661.1 hypothetical protein GCM10017653_27310 [Ancylobacter defluvii]
MASFTLREFSDVISRAEARRNLKKLDNQFKGLAARGLLTQASAYFGPRGALLFPEIECYRARLLIALIEAGGIASDDLAQFNVAVGRSLPMVVASLGEASPPFWLMAVDRIRDPETDEVRASYPHWIRDDRPLGSLHTDLLQPDPEGFTLDTIGPIEMVQTVPVTRLLLPLWRQFRKHETAHA